MSDAAENKDSLPSIYVQPELQTQAITATDSEMEAMDSPRAESIRNFSDDNIVMLKMRDLGNRILTSRDNNQLLLPIEDLHIYPGLNPRLPSQEWESHIEKLTDSLIENGFWSHKPIYAFVSKDGKAKKIFIADGESRYHAVNRAIERGAKIDAVPVRLAPEGTSIEEIMLQLAPSNKSREFTPLEKALLAQRLSRFGSSVVKIAQNLEVSTEYVHQLLALASAPAKVREMVQRGDVPAGMAIDVMRGPAPETAVEQLTQALATAKATGRDRASPKHLQQNIMDRAIKRHSTTMHQTLKRLTESETYCLLDDGLREDIDKLIAQIIADAQPKQAKVKKGSKKASNSPQADDDGEEGGGGADNDAGEAKADDGNVQPKDTLQDGDSADADAQPADEAKAQAAAPAGTAAPAKKATIGNYARVDQNVVRPRPKK